MLKRCVFCVSDTTDSSSLCVSAFTESLDKISSPSASEICL